MKLSTITYTITGLSFLLAVGSAIFINPILITSLVCTAMIYQSAARIRRRELR